MLDKCLKLREIPQIWGGYLNLPGTIERYVNSLLHFLKSSFGSLSEYRQYQFYSSLNIYSGSTVYSG